MWRGSRKSVAHAKRAPTTKSASTSLHRQARVRLSHSDIRARRNKRRLLIACAAFVLLIALVGGVGWLSHASFLAVQKVTVEGTTTINPADVEASLHSATETPHLFGLISRQNILTYPARTLEETLAYEYPRIAHVVLRKQFFAREVSVQITQRLPYALWCMQEKLVEVYIPAKCFSVDEAGFVYESAEAFPDALTLYGGLPLGITDPLRTDVAADYFSATSAFIATLAEQGLRVRTVHFDDKDATLVVAPNWSLKVALDKDLGAVAFNLEALLKEQNLQNTLETIEYIDMRFDERVYIKERTATTSIDRSAEDIL